MTVPPKSRFQLSAVKRRVLERLRESVESGHLPRSQLRIASPSQRQLWLLEQRFERAPYPYNQSASLSLTGALEPEALGQSLDAIVRRHAALRTCFELVNGDLVPRVDEHHRVPLQIIESAAAGDDARRAELDALARDQARQRFDLARGPLVRATLVRYAAAEHALMLTFHHIAVDGLSLHILIDELAAHYDAFCSRRPSLLDELAIQHGDFAAWQHAQLQGPQLAAELAYWKHELAGELPVLELPLDRVRLSRRTCEGARAECVIPPATVEAIARLGREHGATLFMTLLAAYNVLLHRYSGQPELCVGAPTAGRSHGDTAGLIGCFINQVVYRTRLDGGMPFSDLLRRVAETAVRAMAHQDLPFDVMVGELALPRDKHHNPVFQTLFGLQDRVPGRRAGGCELGEVVLHNGGTAKFDVEVNVFQSESRLVACLDYATDVLDAGTAERMVRHYVRILERVAEDPALPIGALPILDDDERRRIVGAWNATARDYPEDRCVHELFSEQAARTPRRVALVFEGTELGYRELDERSNQLAHHLRGRGVSSGVLVGLCLERSLDLVVAVLGVLKAGGAYVPLDPRDPAHRLAYILDEARVSVVVTQHRLAVQLPSGTAQVVHIDHGWAEIARESAGPLAAGARPDDLMYVMYTSGSSGRPKGVMLDHRAVTNRVVDMQRAFFTEHDVVLHKTPYTFDVAVGEMFCPLIVGARLVIARPDGHRDAAYLLRTIEQHGVTVTELVPSMLQVVLEAHDVATACRSLRLVISSGEVLPRELQARWFDTLAAELYNVYGPTEAGEVTVWRCVRGAPPELPSVPIGTPMANLQIYILDQHGQPAPIGVRGELFIGGVGLARGYLGRPDLTAERFVPDPFSGPGRRLYRTGDLARYRADGVIEYGGRTDFQVKIRGVRIELDEIESVLRQRSEVRDVVVVAREDRPGDRRLVAYVVADHRAPVSLDALRATVREQLPDVMVPAAFVLVDALPVTASGKLDRKALPAPEQPSPEPGSSAALTDTERAIAAIWSDVLGVDHVGVRDDFFELGGNSLLVVQVSSRIRGELGVEIAQQELFEAPTVAELAAKVDAVRAKSQQLLHRIPQTDAKVAQARAILEDPMTTPAAKLGAKRFLEALNRG